jgi:hypothetical protein
MGLELTERTAACLLTVSEVHVNIVRSDVGSHGNNWGIWQDFADANRSGNSVEIGHYDVHENQIVRMRTCASLVDLVDCL